MSPADIAAEALGIPVASIKSVAAIKHGLTNQSWLVHAADTAVVVRVSHTQSDKLQIDRVSEAKILATVAESKVGAEVLLCDPQRSWLVTRYLGATWTSSDTQSDVNIVRVAQLLRRLHSLEPPTAIQRVELVGVVQGYLDELDAQSRSDIGGDRGVRMRALDTARSLATRTPCLCHNDVHALNLIDDGRLRLIDWEYAGLGERSFDLASICVYERYDASQRRRLLEAYAAEDARLDEERLERACWLFDYIRTLWLAVRASTPH